jgi:hypothetical protein
MEFMLREPGKDIFKDTRILFGYEFLKLKEMYVINPEMYIRNCRFSGIIDFERLDYI